MMQYGNFKTVLDKLILVLPDCHGCVVAVIYVNITWQVEKILDTPD